MSSVIIDLLLNGLTLGATYAIASVGFSLLFGVMRILNISYGALLVLSAYVMYFVSLSIGAFAGLIIAIISVVTLCLLIERCILYPFRSYDLNLAIFTLCVGIIIEQAISLTCPRSLLYIMASIPISGVLEFFGVKLSLYRLFLLILSIIVTVCLWVFIKYTKIGKAIRAVSQDEEVAAMYGIPIKQIRMLTTGIVATLVSIAGFLLNSIYMFSPSSGWEFIGIAIAIAIFGGLGKVFGVIVSGYILGVVESFIGYYISTNWRMVSYFFLIFITLILRPEGVLTRKKK
jgi:branched-chain amino acid transport system permease protein